MPNDPAHIRNLLISFIENRLGSQELDELFDFIERDPRTYAHLMNSAEIKDLLRTKSFSEGEDKRLNISEQISDRMRERLMSSINEMAVPVFQAPVHKMRPRLAFRRVAAAAIILILFSGTYFFLSKNKVESVVAKVDKKETNDIAPGSNKAILTLANGVTVILDSAKNGLVAEQGSTKISKLKTGEITYNEQPEKPNENSADISFNTLTVPRGGQYELVLPDGSTVWLNAASSIKYPTAFTGKERRVTITGEAYFEVIHNATKPFRVEVNGSQVEDIGTHFNINAYSDEPAIKTTLIEGAVKVNSILLKPGQQAILTASQHIKVVSNVNTENVIAWKEGKFRYASEDIGTIMRQVARWYNVEIIYRGKFNETFTGGIPRQENISEFLKLLEYSATTLKFEIDGKRIIVEPK